MRTAQYFIDKEEAESTQPEELRRITAEQARERLKYMTFYATTRRCLRADLLRYFGEKAPSSCGNWAICLAPRLPLPEFSAARPAPARPEPARRKARRDAARLELGEAEEQLLAALYAVRKELARKEKLPAFMIFPDAVLREICARRPKTTADLLRISGIGEVKAARYGDRFLEAVRAFK